MGVLDFVADYFREDPVGIESFALSKRDLAANFEISTDIWDIPDPAMVGLGYDLSMPRGLRMYIEKRQEIRVFITHLQITPKGP